MPSVEGMGDIHRCRRDTVDTLLPTSVDFHRSDSLLPISKAVSVPPRATLHHCRILVGITSVGTTTQHHRALGHADTPPDRLISRNRHSSQRHAIPCRKDRGRGTSRPKVPGPVSVVGATLSTMEAESAASFRGTVDGDYDATGSVPVGDASDPSAVIGVGHHSGF